MGRATAPGFASSSVIKAATRRPGVLSGSMANSLPILRRLEGERLAPEPELTYGPMDPFHRSCCIITLSHAERCDGRASKLRDPSNANKDRLMSKPGYVGLLTLLVYTTATLLSAYAEAQQPATPNEATTAQPATPAPADDVAGKSLAER